MVARCKSETASGSTRRNGYSPNIASRNGCTPNPPQKNQIKRSQPSAAPTLFSTACPRKPQTTTKKRSLPPCPIENAIAPTANAPSRKASTPTPCTANTIAVKPAHTTTRAVKSVQAKAAIAPTPNNRAHKKVEPNQAPLAVSGFHHPAVRYGGPCLAVVARQP